jgi:hypothetical protein
MESLRTVNPRYAGAPPNMDDGRLFTDYRRNCELVEAPPIVTSSGPAPRWFNGFDRRAQMMKGGQKLMNEDRMFTTWIAGTKGRVDTMVPELNKRICTSDGCTTLPAQAVGLGTGRLPLPGRSDLAAADPDVVALRVTPGLFDTFSSHLVGSHSNSRLIEDRGLNRYSAPYGYY